MTPTLSKHLSKPNYPRGNTLNAKVEYDPSLFETEINGYIKEMKMMKVADGEENKLQANIIIRISDDKYMDQVLAIIAPTAKLNSHNIASREDWLQSILELVKGQAKFDQEYKDHQVTFRISTKNMGTFSDCKLTSFRFDVQHSILYCNILARMPAKGTIEQLSEVLGHGMRLKFKRGEHWSAQNDAFEGDDDKTESQTEIDPKTAEKIEKAKDKANQANNEKARSKRGTSK